MSSASRVGPRSSGARRAGNRAAALAGCGRARWRRVLIAVNCGRWDGPGSFDHITSSGRRSFRGSGRRPTLTAIPDRGIIRFAEAAVKARQTRNDAEALACAARPRAVAARRLAHLGRLLALGAAVCGLALLAACRSSGAGQAVQYHTSTTLAAGDSTCPAGGYLFTFDGGRTAYACSAAASARSPEGGAGAREPSRDPGPLGLTAAVGPERRAEVRGGESAASRPVAMALAQSALARAEAEATLRLRGCYLETRFRPTDRDDLAVTFYRCGGPAAEPHSYQVGFIFRLRDAEWTPYPYPLVERPGP